MKTFDDLINEIDPLGTIFNTITDTNIKTLMKAVHDQAVDLCIEKVGLVERYYNTTHRDEYKFIQSNDWYIDLPSLEAVKNLLK